MNIITSKSPKTSLGFFPTPVTKISRLSEALRSPQIYIKRDGLTGLALGRNKTRKLETILGDALAQGSDTIITAGGKQPDIVPYGGSNKLGAISFIDAVGTLENETIKLTPQLEGILLDPVYTGRAMGGLIDVARTGQIDKDMKAFFWHTGGAPALFAYSDALDFEFVL